MKKNEVEVGKTYVVKVSNKLVPVRLDSVSSYGGWNGTNLRTNRGVRIRSAMKLRKEYVPKPKTPPVEATVPSYGGFKEGDRVELSADEYNPRQVGKIVEAERGGMFIVELDKEFWDADDHDGIREVYFTDMKKIA